LNDVPVPTAITTHDTVVVSSAGANPPVVVRPSKHLYDFVQVLLDNLAVEGKGSAVKRKHKTILAPDGTKIEWEPDSYRHYYKAQLIFEVGGECWMFLEFLKPAHSRRQQADWYEPTIRNWAHVVELPLQHTEK
jgi:hypothetical protein